ncbi:MAG TPA: Calx-beta domain-containing protein [Candidatus Peribacteraceae bacterium]|nr:Calx-beta domain-containing protein [Candidatus Peribacteraceae bacterium]
MLFHSRTSRFVASAFAAGILLGVVGTTMAASVRGSSVFPDIPSGSYFDSAVGQMYSMGIIKGYQNGNFGPNDPVTRADVAVMLQRFYNEEHGISNDSSSSTTTRSSSSRSSAASSTSSSSSKVLYGTVRFTTNNFVVGYATGTAKISVVRIGGATGQLNVDYATGSGSAVAGTDYDPTSGTLNFANGETSKTFTVNIKNNPFGGNKTIPIILKNISAGAALGDPSTATITISSGQSDSSTSSTASAASSSSVNSMGTLSLSATSYMVNEKDGTLTVTVNRSGGTNGTVGVSYATTDGTAHAGAAYTNVNGTLTFNAGETTKTFSIPISYNSNVTGNRSFTVALGNPTGGANLDALGTSATVTIFDYESGVYGSGGLKFAKSEYDVSHNDGNVVITVQRVGGADGIVTVNYDTENVTASSGNDYTTENGTLTFQPGETSKTIVIPILNSGTLSNTRSFNVALTSPTAPATLVSPYVTSVMISN